MGRAPFFISNPSSHHAHWLGSNHSVQLLAKSRVGVSDFHDTGAEAACTFSAGDHAANPDTMKAAAKCSIVFDLSYNYCSCDSTCKLADTGGPQL